MQAALVHQGTGHHLVIDEVASQEPIVGVDVHLAADAAKTESAPRRLDRSYAVNEFELPAGQGSRGLQFDRGESRTEGRGEVQARGESREGAR